MLNGLPKNFYKKNLQNDVRILDSIIIMTESLANTLYSFILSTQKKKYLYSFYFQMEYTALTHVLKAYISKLF